MQLFVELRKVLLALVLISISVGAYWYLLESAGVQERLVGVWILDSDPECRLTFESSGRFVQDYPDEHFDGSYEAKQSSRGPNFLVLTIGDHEKEDWLVEFANENTLLLDPGAEPLRFRRSNATTSH